MSGGMMVCRSVMISWSSVVRWSRGSLVAWHNGVVWVAVDQQLVATLHFRYLDGEGVLDGRGSVGMTVMGVVSIGKGHRHGDDHGDECGNSDGFHFRWVCVGVWLVTIQGAGR